jgi:Tol biopolymer transport system component
MSQDSVERVHRYAAQVACIGAQVACIGALLFSVAPAEAAFPGRNGRIAFSNIIALWSVFPDGSGLEFLGGGFNPRYSPSGRMVAYGCGTEYQASCRRGVGIRIRRADGAGRPRAITRNKWDDHPDWSPGGKRIVFTRYPGGRLTAPQLRIYQRGHSRPLTRGSKPAWSVKGEIAFEQSFGRIYVIRPDGTGLRRITAGFDPEWSPDGRKLIYGTNRCGFECLYTIGRDRRGMRRLGGGSGISGGEPAFSPDGSQVAFTAGIPDRIVVMRSNGRTRQTVFQAADDYAAGEPDWQPLHGTETFAPCGASASAAC